MRKRDGERGGSRGGMRKERGEDKDEVVGKREAGARKRGSKGARESSLRRVKGRQLGR